MPKVEISGQEVYFLLGGLGKPLLFVHGSGADHTLWGYQFQALKRHYSIAALDLNGHGRSPRREGDGLKTYTEDVLAVIEALEEPVFLVGHSLGGAVALNVALESPESLRAIGLVGTGAKLRVHPQILSLIDEDFIKAVELILSWAFAPNPSSEIYQRAQGQMVQNGPEILKRDLSTCDRFDVMDRLHEMAVPALIICGRDDELTPIKYSEYLRDNLPEARLEIIEGAGHMVMLERPDELNSILARFAQEL
jgi:pimeloyl-ACP methyl ester carboxylesterase